MFVAKVIGGTVEYLLNVMKGQPVGFGRRGLF